MSELKLIVPDNFIEFGKLVNKRINSIRKTNKNYIIRPDLVRFSNGEGKCVLPDSIRGKDTYILTDVSNYSITYKSQVGEHNMMPDEHWMDIIRIISSTWRHAYKLRVIMPYLYQSRQDKRTSRESLDLSLSLQQLAFLDVDEVITADVHNKSACDNASPKMPVENFYCSDDILLNILNNEKLDFDKLMVVAPDKGAFSRANFYSDILGVPLGVFEKTRDYTILENGKHPISSHKFLSDASLEGKDSIVVDDMISSGGSILDTARQLKIRGANRVFLISTFGFFTSGIDEFNKEYSNGTFDKVYITNLNYVPDYIKATKWLKIVDCSEKVAQIICSLNKDRSINKLLKSSDATIKKIEQLRE